MKRWIRFLGCSLALALVLATAPALARAGSDAASATSTTVVSGPLTVRVTHNPFAIEVVQSGRTVLRSAPGALAFAVGPAVRAQTPVASYGVFAEAKQWIPATSAVRIGDNRLRVATLDPTRTFDVTLNTIASGVIELNARLSNPVGVAGRAGRPADPSHPAVRRAGARRCAAALHGGRVSRPPAGAGSLVLRAVVPAGGDRRLHQRPRGGMA